MKFRLDRVMELVGEDEALASRLATLREFTRQVRTSEYHITNACNLRCVGCWFFEYDFDQQTRDERSIAAWKEFARRQREERGVTAALLVGGEPTLFPDRISAWVENMLYVTISSNGYARLPREGFERVCVALTLFGGGPLDDELRAVRPGGVRFSGLFERALRNYRNDPRAVFIYAVSRESIPHMAETVRRIGDNGNRVCLNYYSRHGDLIPLRRQDADERLLDEALRVRSLMPEVVACDELFLRTVITGRTSFGEFGYAVCPSVSSDHPAHAERMRNGNPVLPRFNVYAPDLKTINFCCTSGRCEDCRDSQAIYSWLLVSFKHFLDSRESLLRWLTMAEGYWSGFIWSPYHPSHRAALAA